MQLKNSTPIDDAKSCPAGSGTGRGYSVEARFNYHDPKTIMGMVFDNRWREVPWRVVEGHIGIPRPYHKGAEIQLTGLLTRHEAEALRWAAICAADATDFGGSLCLETRIVEHKVEYSYRATPVAYIDAFDMRGDMPDDMVVAQPEVAA